MWELKSLLQVLSATEVFELLSVGSKPQTHKKPQRPPLAHFWASKSPASLRETLVTAPLVRLELLQLLDPAGRNVYHVFALDAPKELQELLVLLEEEEVLAILTAENLPVHRKL